MKTTLSLRAILYEKITLIFENITDFVDNQFLQSVFRFIYDESFSKTIRFTGMNPLAKEEEKKQASSPQ